MRCKRTFEATGKEVLRRSRRMSRSQEVTNKEINRQTVMEETVERDKPKQLIGYNHVQRMIYTGLPKHGMEWIPHHKTRKGMPKRTWCKGI